MLQTGALMNRRKGGGVGRHFRNESDNHRMLVNMILAMKIWIHNKMSVRIQTSTVELNQVEVAALARSRPQVCAVDEHLHHHEQSIRAVCDHLPYCNSPVCAVGVRVLPESKKEQVNKHLNQRSKTPRC